MIHALDGQAKAADGDVTQVMVGCAAESETVDTLITAGRANSRAEAIRWALARIRERPAYAKIVSTPGTSNGSRPNSNTDALG